MHASIALCLMMVGGPIAPEPEIIDVPLFDPQSSPTAMDDLEWRERNKRYRSLPHVPTLGEERSNDSGPGMRPGMPTNPYAPQRRPQTDIPMSPTDPGYGGGVSGGGVPAGPMPTLPGSGISQGYGNEGQGYTSNRPAAYSPPSFAKPVMGNYGGTGVQTTALSVPHTPMASDTMNNINYIGSVTGLGVPTNPLLNNSVSMQKPFAGYQPPSGYSPWMGLFNSTLNNSSMSNYTAYVQPAMQQQSYNRQVAEQINGVRNYLTAPPSGSLRGEVNMGAGNGLANPDAFLNYGPYYPQMPR